MIGRLEIPRLHITTVVLEGDDANTLRYAAGHIPWTPLPKRAGNVGIAALRVTFFRPLLHIAQDDRIKLMTPDCAYEYAVESIWRLYGPMTLVY